jgi:hypothetical protein
LLLAILWLSALVIPETRPVRADLFLERWVAAVHPEPLEHFRYVACIFLLPLLFLIAVHRILPAKRAAPGKLLWMVGLVVRIAFATAIIALIVHQETKVNPYLQGVRPIWGLLGIGLVVLGWGPGWLLAKWRTLTFASRVLHAGLVGIPLLMALALTVVQLMPSVQVDGHPDLAIHTYQHLPYQVGEFVAVLNGRTPLVNYFPQYQTILGYALAPVFMVVGLNFLTFSLAMVVLATFCLLVFFEALRRTTESGWKALALYVPLLGVSFLSLDPAELPGHQRVNTFTYFAVGPIRYLGPCLILVFLIVYLQNPTWRRFYFLSFVAGLAALNNLDFGLPAAGAALLTVLLTDNDQPLPGVRRSLGMLLRFLPAFLLPSALFALGTYARSGQFPAFLQIIRFQRLMAVEGLGMLPMPKYGLHLVVFATFLGAIARAVFGIELDRLRRGNLLYAGICGCGISMYYVGRSHPHTLTMMFPMWSFAASLLTVTCWEELRAHLRQRNRLALAAPITLLMTLGYCVCAAQIVRLPNVGSQIARLRQTPVEDPYKTRPLIAMIHRYAQAGERVIVIHLMGHTLAREAGVQNVFPFTAGASVLLRSHLNEVFNVGSRNGVRWLFIGRPRDGGVSAEELTRMGAILWDKCPGGEVWELGNHLTTRS